MAMSAPQLTDASTSSEWFRTVAEAGATDKPRSPSQASIPADLRRKRFVRLVTYTMGGLVAFTALGLASFSMRQKSMQSALTARSEAPTRALSAAPEAITATAPSPTPLSDTAAASPAPVAEVAAQPDPSPAHAVAPAHLAGKSAPLAKHAKKPAMRSPFLGKR